MKRKLMTFGILGIIVLLLSFAPMTVATVAGQETSKPRWG